MSQVTIDDTDTDVIHYTGPWLDLGHEGEFMETTHGSGAPGAQMQFSFTGVWVGVYGTIGLQGLNASFVLDNGTQDGYTYQLQILEALNVSKQQLCYGSPLLPDGTHSLVMTAGVPNTTQVFLDYIRYNTSSSVTDSAASSTIESIPTSTVTVTTCSRNSTKTAMTAGIVVTVVILLLINAATVWFFMRRLRQYKRILADNSAPSGTGWASPLAQTVNSTIQSDFGPSNAGTSNVSFLDLHPGRRDAWQADLAANGTPEPTSARSGLLGATQLGICGMECASHVSEPPPEYRSAAGSVVGGPVLEPFTLDAPSDPNTSRIQRKRRG